MDSISKPTPAIYTSKVVQHHLDNDFARLTQEIRDDDPGALEGFKRIFEGGIQFFLKRADVPASDHGTLVTKCFSILQTQIKADPSFNSSSIPKRVLAIVKSFSVPSHVSAVTSVDVERANIALKQMSNQGRQAVVSYFANGHTESEICTRLGITTFTFQQFKSEAKFAFHHALRNMESSLDHKSRFIV